MQIRSVCMVMLCWAMANFLSIAHAKKNQKAKSVKPAVMELTVSPQAIERPLMKYRLLPAEHELRDGNAATILLRIPSDQTNYMAKIVSMFSEYLDLPLTDSKVKKSGKVFKQSFYDGLKRAAYRRTAKWEYPIGEGPLGDILLPDVGVGRWIVGSGLSVRIRYHIATGKLDKAREGILVGLANSRHYSRTPFAIIQVTCAHIDSQMLSRVEELISVQGSSNLYWALTALPRPFIDTRPSAELYKQFVPMTVPGLDNLDKIQTEEEWEQRAFAVIRYHEFKAKNPKVTLKLLLRPAMAELPGWIEGGADRVRNMSESEAVLRWLLHVFEEQADEAEALTSLEPQIAIPRLTALEKRLADFGSQYGFPALSIFNHPLDWYVTTRGVQRKIDALRIIEAIRNYAATHNSRLPKTLSQIVETPIPNDPFTDKPFHYKVVDGTATLSAEGIEVAGKKKQAIHYRIKLRK